MADSFKEELEGRIARYVTERTRLKRELLTANAALVALERRLAAAVELYEQEFGLTASVADSLPRTSPIRQADARPGWLEAITEILAREGPLHVAEIWSRLVDAGFQTEASDPLRAIVAVVVRNPRTIQRIAPNTFALTERQARAGRA